MARFIVFVVMLFLSLAFGNSRAHAQLLLDQSMGSALGAGASLGAASQNVGVNVIFKRLTQQGYTNIHAVPGNPQQFVANAPNGMPVTLIVNGAIGQIVSALPR